MKSPIPSAGVVLRFACLPANKLRPLGVTPQHLRRLFHLIPLRERYALRLTEVRGASQRELAGLLGVSPRTVRRLLDRARGRLRDPLNLALIARWHRLDPAEQRLVDLHRFKGVPLRDVARLGLVCLPAGGGTAAPACLREVKALWRRVERKGQRWARGRQDGPSDPGPDAAALSSSKG